MATMTWWSLPSSISPLDEDQWAMGDLTNGRNTLPKELKTCTNINTFKKLLKAFYLKRPTCSSYIHNVHFSFFIHLLVYSSFLYTLHFYLRKYLFFIYVFLWFSLFNIVERYRVIYIYRYINVINYYYYYCEFSTGRRLRRRTNLLPLNFSVSLRNLLRI